METVEEGFQINVYSRKSCPGLLVFILEALEEIGLSLFDARVSCEHSFQLQAIGKEVRDVTLSFELYLTQTYRYSHISFLYSGQDVSTPH